MARRNNPFVSEQEAEYENSPENSEESPASGVLSDSKMTSTSSPRRSRRAMQKRVVSVPIKEVDSSRHKGEMSTPPSDSWAWRKYGQKPIKGSPYPRGYYRCSSSKGCPARKQVERSRADPTMLMVTYSCEHNHPGPAASKNNHNRNHHRNQNQENINPTTTTTTTPPMSLTTSSPNVTTTSNNSDDDQISTCVFTMEEEFTTLDPSFYSEFAWFTNFETTSSTVLESPILGRDGSIGDADIATIFSTKEEDESLFADLEELPECSLVFRRGVAEESRRLPLCRTTAG